MPSKSTEFMHIIHTDSEDWLGLRVIDGHSHACILYVGAGDLRLAPCTCLSVTFPSYIPISGLLELNDSVCKKNLKE